MSRPNFNDGQELIYQDFNRAAALAERNLYDRIIFKMLQGVENAFFQDDLKASYLSSTSVSVSAGLGFQTDNTQVSPEPTKRLLYRSAAQTLNLTAPDGVNDRIDRVCIKHARVVTLNENRKYKAPITGTISTVAFDVEKDWEAEYLVVAGTPSLTPVAPAIPSGYLSIATLLVSAVTGMSGPGAVTDTRSALPVGGSVVLNTLGYTRLTSGVATPLSTLMGEIDALLKRGYQEYTDFDNLGADPAAPGASKNRFYFKSGVAYFKDSASVITPIGSGGGGGGGANWYPGALAPVEDTENGELVWVFSESDSGSQTLTLFVRVPNGFVAGRQISMYLGAYSPSSSNAFKLKTTTTLVRKNNDAISSVANQYASTNAALTNTVANQYREVLLDLTNATGQINGFAVSPGDLLKVELSRDAADTDTADIRMMPSSTEVKFG